MIARRVSLSIALLLLSWLCMGQALADTPCGFTNTQCSSAEAKAECSAHASAYTSSAGIEGATPACEGPATTGVPGVSEWACKWRVSSGVGNCGTLAPYTSNAHYFRVQEECPGGYSRNPDGTCMNRDKCLSENAGIDTATAAAWLHSPSGNSNKRCVGGCEMVRTGNDGTTCTNGSCITMGQRNYSGNSCSADGSQPNFEPGTTPAEGLTDPNPPPQKCLASNAETLCVKPNGQVCASASNGRQVCWKRDETGEKSDGPVLQKRVPGPNEVAPPNMILPNGDPLTKQGNPIVSTVTNNNTTTTTTITNYVTGNGTNAGNGSGTGAGQGTGAPAGGENNDGSGDGKEGDGKNNDAGSAGDGVGTLYTKKSDTVGSEFATFKTKAMASPLINASSGFLTVNVAGACPAWTIPETYYWQAMVFDYHCSGPLADAIYLGGYLCLAIGAWVAFKIAIY